MVLAIAAHDPEESISREVIGIDPWEVSAANATQLTYTQPDDGMVWWGMQAYVHPMTVELGFTMVNDWQLYGTNETAWNMFHTLGPLNDVKGLPQAVAALLCPAACGPILGPVSSYYHRTPDVALASALDYNKGGIGAQQHAWQATLNGTVLVFTTAPGPDFNLTGSDTDAASTALMRLAEEVVAAAAATQPRLAQELDAAAAQHPLGATAVHAGVLSAVADGLHALLLHRAPESDVARTLVPGVDALRRFPGTYAAYKSPHQAPPTPVPPYSCGTDYADACWTGSASMPRVGQHRNVLIAL